MMEKAWVEEICDLGGGEWFEGFVWVIYIRYSRYMWFIRVIYIGIYMCVIYGCGDIYRGWRWGHIQRKKAR